MSPRRLTLAAALTAAAVAFLAGCASPAAPGGEQVQTLRVGAVTETVTVLTTVYVLTRRLVPLKDVQGYLVNPKAGDPTKALQKVDPTKLLEQIGKSPKPLIAAGRTPTPAELKDAKEGSLLLVVPASAPAPRDPTVPVPLPVPVPEPKKR